ncbi:MAG: RNA-guided pseudouridylation complex pseudouridine synthase subunit Cbf5 [Halobacteriaceae archaeon]
MSFRGPPDDRDVPSLLSFGVVTVDKPAGPSAHQVSAWVRDMVADTLDARDHAPIERAAHAGTLDPDVTGCLPVFLGTATRCVPAVQGTEKTYVAVLELHADPPTDLEATLAAFEGELYQRPPRKSAVTRRLRTRRVSELSILERDGRQVLLWIRCAAGTYIRKLCHHLGLALGTGAHMGDLRRVGADPFDDTDLHILQDLADGLHEWETDGDEDWLRAVVEPAERALEHLPRVTIAYSAAEQVAEGAPVYAPGVIDAETETVGDRVVCVTPDEAAVCLGQLRGDPDAATGTVVELDRVLV